MFNGKKEDFEDFIKYCENQVEFLHTSIKSCLERQEYCKNKIHQEVFRDTFCETLDEEVVKHEELQRALKNVEDLL